MTHKAYPTDEEIAENWRKRYHNRALQYKADVYHLRQMKAIRDKKARELVLYGYLAYRQTRQMEA